MMKSSDCVIKHAGVYSTGLAMVVCVQNYSLFLHYEDILCKTSWKDDKTDLWNDGIYHAKFGFSLLFCNKLIFPLY